MLMVISGACLLAAPPLSCLCGGVDLPPPLFLALEAAAAIAEEVRAGPPFRGRRGRPFLFLFLIVKIAIKCCNRRLKEKEYLRLRFNVLLSF